MSIRKIIAIIVIFLLGSAGWVILGTATSARSKVYMGRLNPQVESLWGTSLVQTAPSFTVQIPGTNQVRWLMPAGNNITVALFKDYRQKGLIWYSTFNCDFKGVYMVTNKEEVSQKIRVHFDFPAKGTTYKNFAMFLDNKPLFSTVNTNEGVSEVIELASGESSEFKIKYTTRGIDTWKYQMDQNAGRVQNFFLKAVTNFHNVDYTERSLSPMSVQKKDSGMVLTWNAKDLITRGNIGVVIPEKLNPGPLTSRITYFAPVCLIFFFILVAVINIMYEINIHPMHYLFVTAGFFSFHLLLSYLVGHMGIHKSFLISAVISVFLVTSYLYTVFGRNFPWKIAAAGQVFFLILFSYSFFIKGITGLTVALGSVVTLAILMKVTAHVNWDQIFKAQVKSNHESPIEGPPPL